MSSGLGTPPRSGVARRSTRWPPVVLVKRGKPPAEVAGELPVLHRDPQSALVINEQPQHPFALQPWCPRVKHNEAKPIKPDQTAEGAQPQIAVGRLRNGSHRAVRQTVLHLPDGDGEWTDRFRAHGCGQRGEEKNDRSKSRSALKQ